MPISFTSIPLNIRTVGSHIEFDASRAQRGLPAIPAKILFVGQMLAAGTATAAALVRVQTPDQARQLFGRGSMLARMFAQAKKVDDTVETWAVPLADLGGGAKATGTITVTGPATANGTIYLRVGKESVPIGVSAGQAANSIATAIGAAIAANPDLPVTATVATNVATVSAQHKGLTGNDIDVRVNYYQGETLPAGVGLAIVALSGGTGNPDVTAVFTAIGDTHFPTIALAYTDAANLVIMETELAARAGPLRQIESFAYAAARGTQGSLSTLGSGRNCQFVSIIGANASPSPPPEWAAAYAAAIAFNGAIDPARPFQTLPLPGILPPAEAARFTRTERDLLLNSGISTFTVDPSGVVLLERPITTYQTNAQGFPDVAFLDVNTVLTLFYLRYTLRARIAAKFGRCKLADDGNVFGAGQAIVTPSDVRAEIIALFKDWQELGLVENIAQFKRDLIVERDATDRSRLNVLIPTDTVNALRVFAGQIQFLL
ncbi:MAG: bacteriophage Mu tail sheath [Caulobacter sp.]|nr:bacteriophage Mu tail sheath [Caulobacter sp.]